MNDTQVLIVNEKETFPATERDTNSAIRDNYRDNCKVCGCGRIAEWSNKQ